MADTPESGGNASTSPTASAGAAAPASAWVPKFNPWLIAVVVAMAAFMEVLDTSIANVALPYMAGSLGASNDQSTWVLTSYLVSNAIVLPLGAWASSVIGRKTFFLTCIVALTGAFCTSRREREFTRRTAGYAKQEVQGRTDRDVAASD